MTDWLFDTLIWTGALIALVLAARRPVARWFGPQAAYALWALPMLRLLLPPIQLPAWLAPSVPATVSPEAADEAAQFLILNPNSGPDAPVATTDGIVGPGAAASDPATLITPIAAIDGSTLVTLALAVWMIGAAAFLTLRFSAYFRLRSELLRDACEVGRSGSVRLVETPGTKAPLAFGVLSKVVALPQGFMAQSDRAARDLALAHELAHHRGGDLAVNMAVQGLFALHWFNPLGRYGWLALRRDQEAACDARVMARETPAAKAQYASVIASFAAGPNLALAAPMACPVLGDKSIIHRLRSLKMTDTSNRRRIAGRLMLGAAVVALPFTASISYAEDAQDNAPAAAPQSPVPPAAPRAAPLSAPGDVPAPPAPPQPGTPPMPPEPIESSTTIISVDPDTGETRTYSSDKSISVSVDRTQTKNERGDELTSSEVETIRIMNSGKRLSEEERERILAEVRESLAEADKELSNLPALLAESMAEVNLAGSDMGRTVVKMECSSSSDEVATTSTLDDGTKMVMICQSKVMAHALKGLKEARKAIAKSRGFSEDMREDILDELDDQIEEWEEREG